MSLPRPIVDLARGVAVEGAVLAGNVPCGLLPRPDAPGLCVMVAFRDGVAYEGAEEWGMAHLVEHAVFRGTARYPSLRELSRAVEGVGGHLSAFSTREQTAFWAKFPRGNVARACTVLEELLLRPRLDPEALAAERTVIGQERHRETATPGLAAALGMEALLLAPDPSARHPLGTDAFLAAATGDAIRSHLGMRYGRGAMVVAASGALDGDAAELLQGLAGSFPEVTPPERAEVAVELPGPGPVWLLPTGHATQVQVAMGWRLPPPSPEEDTVWRALATLLGAGYTSLLNVALREEAGLSYLVTVTYTRHETAATFKVCFACADSDLDRALALVEDVVGGVAAGRTAPDVVDEALTRRAANHLFELEDPVRLCRLLTSDLLRDGAPSPFAAHLDALEGVTGQALAAAAAGLDRARRLLLLQTASPRIRAAYPSSTRLDRLPGSGQSS